MAFFNSLVAYVASYPPVATGAVALLTFLALNVVLGVVGALKSKAFQLVKVADFVGGDLLQVLVVLVFGLGAKSNPIMATVFYAGAAAVLSELAAKINANFQTVFDINPHIAPPVLPQDPPTAK